MAYLDEHLHSYTFDDGERIQCNPLSARRKEASGEGSKRSVSQ